MRVLQKKSLRMLLFALLAALFALSLTAFVLTVRADGEYPDASYYEKPGEIENAFTDAGQHGIIDNADSIYNGLYYQNFTKGYIIYKTDPAGNYDNYDNIVYVTGLRNVDAGLNERWSDSYDNFAGLNLAGASENAKTVYKSYIEHDNYNFGIMTERNFSKWGVDNWFATRYGDSDTGEIEGYKNGRRIRMTFFHDGGTESYFIKDAFLEAYAAEAEGNADSNYVSSLGAPTSNDGNFDSAMVLDVPGDDTETTYPCQAFEKGFMYEKDGQIVINTEYVYEDGEFKMVDPPTMEESLNAPSYFGSRLDEAAVEGTDGYTWFNYTYGVAKGKAVDAANGEYEIEYILNKNYSAENGLQLIPKATYMTMGGNEIADGVLGFLGMQDSEKQTLLQAFADELGRLWEAGFNVGTRTAGLEVWTVDGSSVVKQDYIYGDSTNSYPDPDHRKNMTTLIYDPAAETVYAVYSEFHAIYLPTCGYPTGERQEVTAGGETLTIQQFSKGYMKLDGDGSAVFVEGYRYDETAGDFVAMVAAPDYYGEQTGTFTLEEGDATVNYYNYVYGAARETLTAGADPVIEYFINQNFAADGTLELIAEDVYTGMVGTDVADEVYTLLGIEKGSEEETALIAAFKAEMSRLWKLGFKAGKCNSAIEVWTVNGYSVVKQDYIYGDSTDMSYAQGNDTRANMTTLVYNEADGKVYAVYDEYHAEYLPTMGAPENSIGDTVLVGGEERTVQIYANNAYIEVADGQTTVKYNVRYDEKTQSFVIVKMAKEEVAKLSEDPTLWNRSLLPDAYDGMTDQEIIDAVYAAYEKLIGSGFNPGTPTHEYIMVWNRSVVKLAFTGSDDVGNVNNGESLQIWVNPYTKTAHAIYGTVLNTLSRRVTGHETSIGYPTSDIVRMEDDTVYQNFTTGYIVVEKDKEVMGEYVQSDKTYEEVLEETENGGNGGNGGGNADPEGGLGTGAIVGIAVGCAAAVAACVVAAVLVARKKKKARAGTQDGGQDGDEE